MTDRKQRAQAKQVQRLKARQLANLREFERLGYVTLPAPERNLAFTAEELDALDVEPMADFGSEGVDAGRGMYTFEQPFGLDGSPDEASTEGRIASYLWLCWLSFCLHVGFEQTHSMDRCTLLVSYMARRTIQPLHLDFASLPEGPPQTWQLSFLAALLQHGSRLEHSPSLWQHLRARGGEDVHAVIDQYLAERDPQNETFQNIAVMPGTFVVFAEHFPHAGSMPDGRFNHRAHAYFTTPQRSAPVDSVTPLFTLL